MKRALLLIAVFAGLAGLGTWGFYAGAEFGGGWGDLGPVVWYVIGGALAVGALTGGLIWLAFESERRGYDEPYDVNRPGGGRRARSMDGRPRL